MAHPVVTSYLRRDKEERNTRCSKTEVAAPGLLSRKPIKVKSPGPKSLVLEPGWAVPGRGVIKRNGSAPGREGKPVRRSISQVAADGFTQHPPLFLARAGRPNLPAFPARGKEQPVPLLVQVVDVGYEGFDLVRSHTLVGEGMRRLLGLATVGDSVSQGFVG